MMENDKLELAWRLVEDTGANVFITGKAGTGKTTFLRRLKEKSQKTIAVLAPTGIAALNAGGVTIHSFFQLSFSPYIPGIGQASGASRFSRFSRQKIKLLRSIDTIVIDEISMVRADVLDAIDAKLRRYRNPSLPMGGVQLVMIGDIQQLPPVVREDEWEMLSPHYRSTYFFDSQVLRSTPFETVELTKVFRQSDRRFLDILNAIRENRADTRILDSLNSRYLPGFNPPEGERYIRLMTHNYQSQRVNDEKMKGLDTDPHYFEASIEGDFPEMMYPVDKRLLLKKGAQVMFVRNDSSADHRYYNGLIGRIIRISDDGVVYVDADNGMPPIRVEKDVWENTEYSINKDTARMTEKVVGRFYQIPLRPAWAITIHKSQGLTFDKAIVNASAAFAHGQTYVALSRCRSLEGLVLERPITSSSIICDGMVNGFSSYCSSNPTTTSRVDLLQSDFRNKQIMEITDLTAMRSALDSLHRTIQVSHGMSFPKLTQDFGRMLGSQFQNIFDVSIRFHAQLRGLMAAGEPDSKIQQRISAACAYFMKELSSVYSFLRSIPLEVDNKEAQRRFIDSLAAVEYEARLKDMLMSAASERIPGISEILGIKRKVATADSIWTRQDKVSKSAVASDIENPALYDILVEWRRKKANEEGVAAFQVLGNKTLVAIANDLPADYADLLAIPGIGNKKKSDYGDEILSLVKEYVDR